MKKNFWLILLALFSQSALAFDQPLFYEFSRSSLLTPAQHRFEKGCTIYKHKIEINITDSSGEREIEKKIIYNPEWVKQISAAHSGMMIEHQTPADINPAKYMAVYQNKTFLLMGNNEDGRGVINNSQVTEALIAMIANFCALE